MIDMEKIITFKDCIELKKGVEDLTEDFRATIEKIINIGIEFGLNLEDYYLDEAEKEIHFDWRGTKCDVINFYSFYSGYYTTESDEVRMNTINIILGK